MALNLHRRKKYVGNQARYSRERQENCGAGARLYDDTGHFTRQGRANRGTEFSALLAASSREGSPWITFFFFVIITNRTTWMDTNGLRTGKAFQDKSWKVQGAEEGAQRRCQVARIILHLA